MQVICEHPRIILNPKAPELLLKYKHWILNGKERHYQGYTRHMFDFDYKSFSPRRNNITLDNIDEQVIIDDSTGETYMLYLAVPCNHCDICKKSKITSFVKRMSYEAQCYNSVPWFVTLTYKKEPPEGVDKRDVQLFLKRFRINLQRNGFDWHIRYVCVGEYGKTTHRAHYHFVFFGINTYSHEDVRRVHMLIRKSWNKGFIQSRCVQPKDDKGFFYTAKYLKKECVVPEGKNPTFMLSSRGNGGIGAPFIDKHKNMIRNTCNVNYKFKNKWTGNVEVIQWSRYVINRVFPSFCRSVSSRFRDLVVTFNYYFSRYSNAYFVTFKKEFRDLYKFRDELLKKYSKYFFIPIDFSSTLSFHEELRFDFLYSIKEEVCKMMDSIDCATAFMVDGLRRKFLGRLFLYQSKSDISYLAYKARDMLSWESSKTVHV